MNKKMYIEVDDKISETKIDTRFLDKRAHSLFVRNRSDFNTSICFETQEQFMEVFGVRKNYSLFNSAFSPSGKIYLIHFYSLSEPKNKNKLWTGRATFNFKGERESIYFHPVIIRK